MNLSEFLDSVAAAHTPERLEGAIVFVALNRGIDRQIRDGLSQSPRHPGTPAPFSHCFLLTTPWRGPITPTLDLALRTPDHTLLWDRPDEDALTAWRNGHVWSGAFKGRVLEYDVPQVTAAGIRWLPTLSATRRTAISALANRNADEPHPFDLPPALTARLMASSPGPAVPTVAGGWSSSELIRSVYRQVLGARNDLAPGVPDGEATVDDLWFSPEGVSEGPTPVTAPATRGAKRLPRKLPKPRELEEELDQGLQSLALVRKLPDQPKVERVMRHARRELRAQPDDALHRNGFLHIETLASSLLQSALAAEACGGEPANALGLPPPEPPAPGQPVPRAGIFGFRQYENLDARWLATIAQLLSTKKFPFISHRSVTDFRVRIPNSVRITMGADWGTGDASSKSIADWMRVRQPHITIHLGDVYYSGTPNEVRSNFLADWPMGTLGSYALNSNHEMYCGGHGYFGVTLKHPAFAANQKASYFSLFNDFWQIIGLDTAYEAESLTYQKGRISPQQAAWLAAQLADARQHQRRVILLSHHQPLSPESGVDRVLLQQVMGAAAGNPIHLWYWGHEHLGVRFKPFTFQGQTFLGRCLGHGGIPYTAFSGTPKVAFDWTELESAGDPDEPRRTRNGFVALKLDSAHLEETFVDEFGEDRATFTL
jgi:hypothetical protein